MPEQGNQQVKRERRIARERPFVLRNRRRILLSLSVVAVIAVVAIAVLQARTGSSGPATAAAPADAALVQAVTGLPQSTFDAIGTGGVANTLRATSAPDLTLDGKPEVLYIGAEYCPFCAAERWAVVVALGRFGSFDGLKTTRSAPDDVYANTPTFSFFGSTYTSQYLAFSGVETETNVRSGGSYTLLQTPTSDQRGILDVYDAPPYTTNRGSIPFIDIGGKYVVSGSSYSPDLFSGMDWPAVAAKLADPTSKQAKAVLGSAYLLTAAFCQLTGGQPAAVCQAAGTRAGAGALGNGG